MNAAESGAELFAALLIGLLAGGIGSVVGVGGGFIAVPAMTFFLRLPPQAIIGASLAMVFFNALSGSIAFFRQRRIDLSSGWKFALATFPGSLLGSRVADYFTSKSFNMVFGFLLLLIAVLMWLQKGKEQNEPEAAGAEAIGAETGVTVQQPANRPETVRWGAVRREITDVCGVKYSYEFNLLWGILFSFLVGFISSVLGIGGGIIHVPFLIMVLGFPPHVAAATSLFVLTWTSLTGMAAHFWLGHVDIKLASFLAAGGIVGAQLGACISRHLSGRGIIKIFAGLLVVAGCRMILG